MIFTIARKELKSLFSSPLAWVVLTLMQLLISGIWVFALLAPYVDLQAQNQMMNNAQGYTALIVAPIYQLASLIMLLVVPILAMRLFAEERRNQTMALLMSAPVSMTEIVLGKFFGLWLFFVLVIGLLTLMPLALLLGGRLDLGLLASLVLGLALLAASYIAVALYASSLTTQPIIAAIVGFGLLLAMLFLSGNVIDNLRTGGWRVAAALMQVFTPLLNFDSFRKGLLDSYSAICMLLLTAAFLVLTIRRLDALRLRG
jgi:ABC-2 type transport system permease protein